MKMKQIGVSLPPYIERKLMKVAKIQKRSVSSLAAEAVALYLDKWIGDTKEGDSKVSVFTGLTKRELIQQVQESPGV